MHIIPTKYTHRHKDTHIHTHTSKLRYVDLHHVALSCRLRLVTPATRHVEPQRQ